VIFSDHGKGQRANDTDLQRVFGTTNVEDCGRVIAEQGELQVSAAERREKVEQKKREMINYIHKYYIDPRTKTPHPVTRIEAAFEQMHLNIDPSQPAERQVQDKVIKKLPEIMPIRRQEMEGTLTVPNKVLGQALGVIKKYCVIGQENYTEGSCAMEISLVPGDYDLFMQDLRDVTKGDFDFDIRGQFHADESGEEKKGKGKGKGGRGGGGRGKKRK